MKICDFTTKELEMFRKECNFTDIERQCFDLKARNKTNIELAMELNVCDSTISATMKSVRAKITAVLEQRANGKGHKASKTSFDSLHPALGYIADFIKTLLENSPLIPESHTTKEWAEMPDRVSVKDKWYAVSDYRTDDKINIPRFKYGDGITLISKLPFVTAAITDNDVTYWDEKAKKIQ